MNLQLPQPRAWGGKRSQAEEVAFVSWAELTELGVCEAEGTRLCSRVERQGGQNYREAREQGLTQAGHGSCPHQPEEKLGSRV